ncbi:ATP-binding cassette domain-containing protein [Staphylococcus kloosii]|uniref:ATP-binding cassette domain-containing protein n=1 Tax=Staphylococcus kloosii TaxID=29384 RepID=UPI00189FA96A|nr:ABC transporter ATP-binding protein [Staphylococcus kloosii]MBF7022121.1 ABC transporter ATP-binding protein [Staphylococcus kloosii]
MTHHLIAFHNVSKIINRTTIIKNFSLTIPPNSTTYIQGTNGIGKSVTLKLIAQLIKPTKGKLKVQGTISYMPDVFPKNNKVTVNEFLTTIYKFENARSVHNMNKTLAFYYDKLNLSQFKNKKLIDLSKGTLQKVNIIQTLLKDADIYIFDEPFNGLDQQTLNNFVQLLKKLKANKALILTSHEYDIANDLATHILNLNNATYTANQSFHQSNVKYVTIPYANHLPQKSLQYIEFSETYDNKMTLTVKSADSNTLLDILIKNNHTILEVREESLC